MYRFISVFKAICDMIDTNDYTNYGAARLWKNGIGKGTKRTY